MSKKNTNTKNSYLFSDSVVKVAPECKDVHTDLANSGIELIKKESPVVLDLIDDVDDSEVAALIPVMPTITNIKLKSWETFDEEILNKFGVTASFSLNSGSKHPLRSIYSIAREVHVNEYFIRKSISRLRRSGKISLMVGSNQYCRTELLKDLPKYHRCTLKIRDMYSQPVKTLDELLGMQSARVSVSFNGTHLPASAICNMQLNSVLKLLKDGRVGRKPTNK